MKRILLAAALLAAAACTSDPERRYAAALGEVRQAVREGRFENAQAIAERELASAPAGSVWAWTFQLYRGEILIERGKLPEVEPVITASLPPDPAFDALRARQKYLAGRVLLGQSKADLEGALKTLGDARRLAPADSDLPLLIGFSEAQALSRLRRPREAEQTLNGVIRTAEARGDRFLQARGWNNLGMVALQLGRWDEAVTRFDRALAFTDLGQTTVYAGSLINAGAGYARLGEFDRALKLQQRALAYHADHGPPRSHVSALGEIGNTYVQLGEPEAALPYYQKALAVAKDTNMPAAVWAGNLAAAQIQLGRWDEAERFNDEARRLKAIQRIETVAYNNLNTAQIALGRGRLDEAERRFQDLIGPEIDAEVRWQAHAGLANIALARGKTAEARHHFEVALDSIEHAQTNLSRTDFQLTFLNRLIEFYQSYVDALVDQGQIERALEVADSSRGRVLAARTNGPPPPRASAAELRQVAARSKTVLLSYWLGRTRSYLWVIGAEGIHLTRIPAAAAEIAALVRQYNGVIGDALADPIASPGNAGDQLYDLLVKPVSAWLPAGTRAILVVDGALHALNFETLPVAGATRHYWIQDVEVQMAPGLSMLAAPHSSAPGPPSLLLIGDPVAHAANFPALKYAGAEIANISRHFPGATVLTEAQASPAAYASATPRRFSFVHFATHASANLESPLDSAVILSGPDDGFKLYARDVADVPLHAELVTVSACRSAGERIYSGEGLVGFAWAFLHAGSSRVIAGLWDVDDRSTSDVMDQLYAGLAAGHPPAQALRAAKLKLLDKKGNYGKPYYWGPFQLFTVVP